MNKYMVENEAKSFYWLAVFGDQRTINSRKTHLPPRRSDCGLTTQVVLVIFQISPIPWRSLAPGFIHHPLPPQDPRNVNFNWCANTKKTRLILILRSNEEARRLILYCSAPPKARPKTGPVWSWFHHLYIMLESDNEGHFVHYRKTRSTIKTALNRV